MPKGKSEAVNRRPDNIMATRKGMKEQSLIHETLHRKLQIKQNNRT